MKSLTIKQSIQSITKGKGLVFGDPESIRMRDEAAKLHKKFKRSGLSEEAFYWDQEIKYFMR